MTAIWLLSALLAGDVAPRRADPPAPECTADSECTIATLQDCCGSCCPPEPAAYSSVDVRPRGLCHAPLRTGHRLPQG
jgi:hypothetical protein